MIVVATSAANDCLYCIVAHGALLRIYAKNPLIADQVAANYRKADITPRQKAMLAFALKVRCAAAKSATTISLNSSARLHRRRRMGHRRDRRAVRLVEPDGQHDRHAAQRRVLPDGTRASRQVNEAALRPPLLHSLALRHAHCLNHASMRFQASSASCLR
jgi:AhpD family alkylhydroperoxidase